MSSPQDPTTVDVSDIVRSTRIGFRIAGGIGAVFVVALATSPEFSLFDLALPLVGIVLGLEGLVLRAEVAQSGRLLKIHSLFGPQRIELGPETHVGISANSPWWSKGIEMPCLEIGAGSNAVKVRSSENRAHAIYNSIELLCSVSELNPPGNTSAPEEEQHRDQTQQE